MSIIEYISIFFLSIVTTIIFVSCIIYSDRKSKEPLHMLLICLFSGVFTICLTLLLGQIILPNLEIISSGLFSYNTNNSIKILILAMVEEYCKLIVLYLLVSKNRNYDDLYDGFVYSSLIALSFGAFETLIYVFNEPTFSSMTSLAILRSFTTIPLHLICGVVMGYYVSVEKFTFGTKDRVFYLFNALLIPTFIHFIYNHTLAHVMNILVNDSLFIIFLIVFFIPFYVTAISYFNKTKSLNDKFINNIKYKNLMTKKEYNEIIKSKY